MKRLWKKALDLKPTINHQRSDYWKMIKQIRKTEHRRFTSSMQTSNGVPTRDKKQIANSIAEVYANISACLDSDAVNYNSSMTNLNPDWRVDRGNHQHRTAQTLHRTILPAIKAVNSPEDLSIEETLEALKHLRKHTSPGEDLLTTEILAYGGNLLHTCLLLIFNAWWKIGHVPPSLQRSKVIPIYKQKGSKSEAKNYRPISLLSSAFKLYEKILETRLREFCITTGCIPKEQFGFQANSGSTEAIFRLLSCIFGRQTAGISIAFLDLSKAFDRIHRPSLWAKLWKLGLPKALLRAIMSTYSAPFSEVAIGATRSDKFSTPHGVRQGSILSSLLFLIAFSDIVYSVPKTGGVQIPTTGGATTQESAMLFADDSSLVATSLPALGHMFAAFNQSIYSKGAVLNIEKTDVLSNSPASATQQWMSAHGIDGKPPTIAKCLGIWITLKNNSWNQHYKKRIRKTKKAFFFLQSRGLRHDQTTAQESIFLIQKLLTPILLHAAEVLTPSTAVIQKVNNLIAYMVANTLGIPCKHLNHHKILWEANIPDFALQLQVAQLRFHRKLICGDSAAKAFYCKGNFLWDHNQLTLQNWNPAWCDLTKATFPSKLKWKQLLSENLHTRRLALLAEHAPSFLQIKPLPSICDTLFSTRITSCTRGLILRARHDQLLPEQAISLCPHCPDQIQSLSHMIFSCHNSNAPDQTQSWIGIELLSHSLHSYTHPPGRSLSQVEATAQLIGSCPSVPPDNRASVLTQVATRLALVLPHLYPGRGSEQRHTSLYDCFRVPRSHPL